MLQFIIPLLLGTLSGTLTGLIPGIHINLIALLTLSLITTLQPTTLIIFITSLAITHTFLDFIPSIFLGAPNEDTALSVLPGHQFLLKGHGHNALKLSLLGSTLAILSLTIITPLFIFLIPKIYPLIQQMMGILLLWVAIFLIHKDKEPLKATLIFLLAGFLGLASLNIELKSTLLNQAITQPLLPLLTGLFATSTLLHSIKSHTIVPEQKIEKLPLPKSQIAKPTLLTIIISPICSLFPGLGSSQAAVISQSIFKTTQSQFLILLGSINTIVMSVSFLTLILFQKTRTGAAFTISQVTTLTLSHASILIPTILLSTFLSIPLALNISKLTAKNIHKIPYTKLSMTTLLFLIIITFFLTGFIGLLILATATTLGITCIEFSVKRSFLMGAILIPTIIYYLPF